MKVKFHNNVTELKFKDLDAGQFFRFKEGNTSPALKVEDVNNGRFGHVWLEDGQMTYLYTYEVNELVVVQLRQVNELELSEM